MSYALLLLELFGRFFLVGLFSVGGGLATLPFLTSMGEATGWFTAADISNMVAISESTPGPMGINMATYVGYTVGGVPGSVLAPLGLIAPSIAIIMIISRVLMKFRSSKYVNYAFYGLRAASVGLIAAACYSVAKIALFKSEVFSQTGNFFLSFDLKSVILCVVVFAAIMGIKKLHPIACIAIAAVIGILFQMG